MNERNATYLSFQFKLILPPGMGQDDLHAHGELVMDKLLDLEQCSNDFTDSSVGTDALTEMITIDLLVLDAKEPATALQRGLDIIRTAVHAAGGATPGWPVISDQPDHVEISKAHDLALI